MVAVSDEHFGALIEQAIASLPKQQTGHLANVAITYEDDPSPAQRQQLALRNDQTLFGLYEGVPLTQRQGVARIVPDKITIFKNPICSSVSNEFELQKQIRHTVWHEVAHYYGLNHDDIHTLDGSRS